MNHPWHAPANQEVAGLISRTARSVEFPVGDQRVGEQNTPQPGRQAFFANFSSFFCTLQILDFLRKLHNLVPVKIIRLLALAISTVVFVGCASTQSTGLSGAPPESERSGFQPKPPYLFNALADTAESAANHTSGPVAQHFRIHSTIFRAMTPQFWVNRHRRNQESPAADSVPRNLAEQDQVFLESRS